MNMSKYPILPNSKLISSKMAKLQGLEKYLIGRSDFLKNLDQNAKFVLFILKNTKVTRPSMFPIMTSL